MAQSYTEKKAIFAALEDNCWERRYYFDVAAARVVCVMEEVRAALQAIYDERGEDLDSLPTVELQRAHQVEMDDERFLRVPTVGKREKLVQCDLFANSAEKPLQRLLYTALDHQDVAWFERILQMEPNEYKRWQFAWHRYLEGKFQDWLANELSSSEELSS